MTPGEPQPAWILHATPYRETSLLVDALTLNDGRVGFVARGVRGARAQPVRAALQPLQPVLLQLRGRGELPMLASADIQASALALSGRPLLSAFYINELLLRLLPRNVPHSALFWKYALCVNALGDEAGLAWTLRRFERDLLEALGYGLPLEVDAVSGAPIDPAGRYRVDPERGPIAVRNGWPEAVSGLALLALAHDQAPAASELTELRQLMRRLIGWRLGGHELRSWRILAEVERGARRTPGRAPVTSPDQPTPPAVGATSD